MECTGCQAIGMGFRQEDCRLYLRSQHRRVLRCCNTLPKNAHACVDSTRIFRRHPQAFLEDTLKHFEIIELGASDYNAVIARVSNLNLVGGAIFDALIAQAALKVKADQLLTFNAKHFSRLGEDVAGIVVTPS